MPEVQEGMTSNCAVSNAVGSIAKKYGSVENGPRCKTAFADVTNAETEEDARVKAAHGNQEGYPGGSDAQLGLPIELALDNRAVRALQRGMTRQQTPLLFGPDLEPENGYQGLQLLGVVHSPRNVILKLSERLFLQAQLFTATAVNVYTPDAFHNGLMKVGRQIRKFRITLAFDFGDLVVAFVTSDGITQASFFTPLRLFFSSDAPPPPPPLRLQFHWAARVEDLPANHFDPIADFDLYLSEIVSWLEARRPSPTQSAQAVIRGAGQHFPGIGAYTVNEVFALAGIPIDIPDQQLWLCACCSARLLEAVWTVHANARPRAMKLLPPMLGNGLTIGVSMAQRLQYARSLFVYGKQEMKTPNRMRTLYLEYKTSMETRTGDKPRYHVFEPSLIAAALNKEPGTNLSHLIFPCNGQADPINPEGQDPLTMYFKSKGLLHTSGAHLHPTLYEPRYIDLSSYQDTKVSTSMILIKKKPMWSLMVPNPEWEIGTLASKTEKKAMLFENRVLNGLKEVIGPRDYTGLPRRITIGKSTQLMVCNFDPRLPPRFMQHVLAHAMKVKPATAAKWKKEYQDWKALVQKERPNFFANLVKSSKTGKKVVHKGEKTDGVKKRRISADKRLVLNALNLNP